MNLTTNKGYWFNLFVALSVLICSLFGGRMYESVCSAAWRKQSSRNFFVRWWAKLTIEIMDLLEKDHCKKSWKYHQRIPQ